MSLAKKPKVILPKDWIVVNSTSFPDRVYYFNVRTGKSSWKEPRNEKNKPKPEPKPEPKPAPPSQKRKNSGQNDRNDTPSEKILSKTPPKASERRILRAKRVAEVPKAQETPQMKEMRKKILEKKQPKTAVQNEKQKCSQLKSANNNKTVNLAAGKGNRNGKLIPQKNLTQTFIRVSDAKNIPGTSSSTSYPKSPVNAPSNVTKNSKIQTDKKNDPQMVSPKPSSSFQNRSSNINSANKRMDSLKQKLNTERKKIEPLVAAKLKRRLSSQDPETEEVKPSAKLIAENKLIGLKSPTQNTAESSPSISQNKNSIFKSLKARMTSTPGTSGIKRNENNKSTYEAVASPLKITKTNEDPPKKVAKSLQDENAANLNGPCTIENRINDSFCEEMEWEPIEEEKVVVEIQEVRMQISTDQTTTEQKLPHYTINGLELSQVSENTDKRILYIVVDTNVFLSNLKMVTEIIEDSRNIKSQFRPIVVVPWMVLQELDYIKDNKSKTKPQQLQKSAKTAVDTLFQYFSSKHPRLKGQTALDAAANRKKFQVESPDDEILQSCLQIRELGYTVVLLSNDKNLCNKAIIHDISTYGRHESIQEMLSLDENYPKSRKSEEPVKSVGHQIETVDSKQAEISDDIFNEAKAIIKHFLSTIVSKEMENLYGENWKKYTIVQPPWSVIDVLKCVSKHWMAVISDVFLKQAEFLVEKLSKMFLNAPKYGQTLSYVSEVLDVCHNLVNTVKSKNYQQVMEKSVYDIKELIATCNQKRKELDENESKVLISHENNNSNDEGRADKAFIYFEQIWTFTNKFCGLTADLTGIPHSITYKNFEPALPVETINRMQPGLVFSLNQLIHALRTVLNEWDNVTAEHPALIALYQSLVNYFPNSLELVEAGSLNIFDLLLCIKVKKDVLKAGLVQLQELSCQFCRIADYRSSNAIVFS